MDTRYKRVSDPATSYKYRAVESRVLEPKIRPSDQKRATRETLVRLVLADGMTVPEARRETARRGMPVPAENTARGWVRAARREAAGSDDVRTIAGRMLRLVSAELADLERQKGGTDLDRLQRLATTLGAVSRLSPQQKRRASSEPILSLLQDGETEGSDETADADVSDGFEAEAVSSR